MIKRVTLIALLLLTLLLAAIAFLSLRWRMAHDSPILLYIAYLLNVRHCVPYRDLFDMNMPGTYALYAAIGRCFGYRDVGFRLADLAVLSALLAAMGFWLRKLGARVAWCATVLFGLKYLQSSTGMSLQREYLLLLPLSLALCVAQATWDARTRAFVVGLLLGMMATIKPQALVVLPVVVLYLLSGMPLPATARTRAKGMVVCATLIGVVLPWLTVLIYLTIRSALPAFWGIVRGYLPLYGSLTERHETISGLARLVYLAKGYLALGGHALWLMPASLGLYVVLYHSDLDRVRRRQVWCMGGLTLSLSGYPVFSGQFWDYHWLPFLYALVMLASLCLVARPGELPIGARLLPPAVLLAASVLAVRPPDEFGMQLAGRPIPAPNYGRDDQIAAYLKAHMRPGDRVQPLDWTRGGAVHAMLMAEAEIATPFVYDFHFYHHVSNPYIQALRKQFVDGLTGARPRYVVEVTANNKPWVSGKDTTREFPELQWLLVTEYRIALSGDGYLIHERGP